MIGLVQTGGTIGSDGDPQAPIGFARFRALWQRLIPPPPEGLVWFDTGEALDSTEITPVGWAAMMALVLDAAEADANGVVVLHGTDTLAQSAAALALLATQIDAGGMPRARLRQPLVITGSMLPLFAGETLRENSNARANAEGAIRLAASGRAGTHVFFAGRRLPAARVVKLDTGRLEAFGVPKGGGAAADLPAAPPSALRDQLVALTPLIGRGSVLTWTFQPEAAAHHRDALGAAIEALGRRLGAIHLIGYGTGNVPAGDMLLRLLERAVENGVLIAVGTAVERGPTDTGAYAAGAWTAQVGALPAGDMTIAATHAKLHVTLALSRLYGWDGETAQRFFQTPVTGERTI